VTSILQKRETAREIFEVFELQRQKQDIEQHHRFLERVLKREEKARKKRNILGFFWLLLIYRGLRKNMFRTF